MLTIDSRVGHTNSQSVSDRIEWWRGRFDRANVKTQVKQLLYGDFAWEGQLNGRPVRVGLELKTLPDLVNSINNGRLTGRQLPGMANLYEFRYLLIEGVYHAGSDGAVVLHRAGGNSISLPATYRGLVGFLATVELAGFHIRQSESASGSAHTIAALYQWWQKPEHHSFEETVIEQPTLYRLSDTEAFFAGMPGVGWKRARAICRGLPTTEALVKATEADLMGVSGIGKEMASRIYKFLRGVK